MQICRHRKSIHKNCKSKNFFDSFWISPRKRVSAEDFRWVICFYLAKFCGLLSHSGKALGVDFDLRIRSELYRSHKRRNDEDFVASKWKELRRIHRRSQTQTRNVKRHWPHRYELIDFPCSLQSFDLADFLFVWPFSFNNSDNLHENFSALKPVHDTKAESN